MDLGNGFNVFMLAGGRVTGEVIGGSGSDSYFIDRSDINIFDRDGGLDRVLSTVDYHLSNGVEQLDLMGTIGMAGIGNSGANSLRGDVGGDTLRGLGGNDGLNAGEGDNLLYGGLDADRLFAGDGDDLLYGGAGNDELIGSGGRDRVSGGGGTDTFYVGGGGRFTVTTVNLATGKAVLDGDNTSVLSGIEDVVGDSGRDALTGDAGANRLEGFTGDDTLLGGAGNDTLYGSLGADLMNGGGGVDVFLYRDAAESKADRNIDQIDGFALAQDIIDLSLIDASPGGDDSAFVFIGSAVFSGSGPQVRIVVDGVAQTTTVQVRLDGSVADDMTILLDNDLALTAANFVL